MPLNRDSAVRMLGEIKDMFEDATSFFRVRRLDRAIENAALYRGWHQFARSGNYTIGTLDPQGEASEGINISRMLVKAAVAQTLKQFPTIEIPSAKDDQRAKARASLTEKLGKSILRRLDQEELHRCVSWSKQTGAGWMKVCWNLNAGRPLPQDYDGFTEAEEKARWEDDGFGNKAAVQLFEGDVTWEFVPTTDGFPDPAAKTRREMHHFFESKLMTIRKAEDRFPVDYFGEETKGRFYAGTSYRTEQIGYQAVAGDDELFYATSQSHINQGNTMVEVIEFWEMPSRNFPRGRFIAFSGSMILAMGVNPYWPTRIPYVLYVGDNIVPGSLYADGLLEDVRTLQMSTNRAASKLREHLDKMTNAHMLVPRNSGIDKNIWGDKAGQVIEYTKGYKPEPLEVPDIPQSMFEYLDMQIARAQTVTGYTDVGRGESQADLSGRAVAFYTENEQSMREPDMASHRRAMLECVQHAVYLYRQYADDGRMIHMIGDDGRLELMEFFEEDYDFDNDFVPEFYTGRPTSRTAKVSEVIEFMGAMMLEDTPGAERARKMLADEFAYANTYDPFRTDRQRSRRENLGHLKDPSTILSVQTYDTHQIHIEEHREYMRSVEFESLPDWQKGQMFMHEELHELMMAGADQAFLQQQQPQMPPGPEATTQPGVESPPDGGAPSSVAPPPPVEQFNAMSDTQQRSTDQV